jgi:adenylate kinase family enzyme
MKKLFISYTSRDQAFKDEFDTATTMLRRNQAIETWDMGEIVPDQQWNAEIQTKLDSADIVVMLLSPRFFQSTYIWDHEFKNTLVRWQAGKVKIAGIVLSKCEWRETPLKDIQLVNKGKEIDLAPNRDAVWYDVVQDLKRML